MMAPQIVLIDANVLFSVTLRDWVMELHTAPGGTAFRPRYTEDILSNVLHNLRCEFPHWPGQDIVAIRRKIEAAFEGGLVEEYDIDQAFLGSHDFDAHIHSAAVACGAHTILTDKGPDLLPPGTNPDTLPYEIWTPDDFLVLVDDSSPELVHEATKLQFAHFMEGSDECDLPCALRKAGAPNFSLRVANHLQTIPIPSLTKSTQQ